MQGVSRTELYRIIERLDPALFGLSTLAIGSLRKLGTGQGNSNYLLGLSDQRFVVRVNIDPRMPGKSRVEYERLRALEPFGIAPKAYCCHDDPSFIIIDYVEGTSLRTGQRAFADRTIVELARLLARVHALPVEFEREGVGYAEYLEEAREYLDAIVRYTDGAASDALERLHGAVASKLPASESHELGIIHGDVCPQNLVMGAEIRLIDWESVKRSDPAREVANVIIDFRLDAQLDRFLESYRSIRHDETLLERARIYEVIMRYHYVLWEIRRVFEIRREELAQDYLSANAAQDHVREAKKQYRWLDSIIALPSFDIDAIVSR